MMVFFSAFSASTFISSLVGSGGVAWAVVKVSSGHIADRWMTSYKAALEKEFESYRDMLEQKRKRLEAERSHRVYTTQTQFDSEFNAIKDIFAALGRVRLTMNGLRPDFAVGSSDENEQRDALIQRLKDLTDRYNVLVDTAESLYPFVPEDIYEQVHTCMKEVRVELALVRTAGPLTFTTEWFQQGETQRSKFSEAYFAAAKLARERLNRLSAVSE